MRKQVEDLYKSGLTLQQVADSLGISKSTAAWHASESARESSKKRRRENKRKFRTELKLMFGGMCKRCNYDRCLDALHFHHRNPSEKSIGVSQAMQWGSQDLTIEEAKKCDLICANCHAEFHSKLVPVAELASATHAG
jgi:hypothetical protein